jgi:23S rRNA pseudouridine1911/1915/1917 synthase
MRVVYEDRSIIVVDKPFGLPSQSPRSGEGDHVFGLLQARYPYVGLHHRLDTPASGLMVLALHTGANASLAEGFREGTISRTYRICVVGDPGEAGTWDEPLDGKPARTHWRQTTSGGGMAVLEVTLDTGRTHQIRRHAVGAGHPVVGDRRHGGAAGRAWPRLALHAFRLALHHPRSGEPVTFECPVPADLTALFARAGTPLTPA